MTQARDLADGKFDTDTLVVDAANNRVGIGTASPSVDLEIASTAGSIKLSDTDGSDKETIIKHSGGTFFLQARDGSSNAPIVLGGNGGGSFDEHLRVLSGGGLTFNGDTATANAINDYEVGTWTPVLGAASVSPTYTAGNSTGHYVKVGDIVHFTWYSSSITFTSTGTGNGHISGLPYTTANGTEEYWVFRYEHGTAIRSTTGGYIVKNADRLFFTRGDNTDGNTWYSSGGYIMVTGSYRAA